MYRYKKRFKEKKKKRILPYFIFSFLFFLIISAIIYVLIFSSFLSIKEIRIEDENNGLYEFIDKRIEKNIFGIKIKNFMFLDSKNIKKEVLSSFPEIEDLEIKSNFFPSFLYINPKLRESLFIFCNNNNCYNVDKNGIAFSYSEKNIFFVYFEKELEIVNLGEKIISEDLALFINGIDQGLEDIEIEIKNENRINVKTREGFLIYFNPKKDLNNQIENLNAIIEIYILEKTNLLEYIDLRFEDRAYYKFR